MGTISMTYCNFRGELKKLKDERKRLVGDDNFSYQPRGLERAYALPCDNGKLAAYVYPEGPTITVYFWEAGRWGSELREIKNLLDELSSNQLEALCAVKRAVDAWVEGKLEALPPSTHGG